MNRLAIGDQVTYWPPHRKETDNPHFPAVVEGFTRSRVRVRLIDQDHPGGVSRAVPASRLAPHHEVPL